MTVTAGYDVGGAHLKIGIVENGRLAAAEQILCPLWHGLDRLDAALAAAASLTGRAGRHAVTMTGELCEVFPDRESGVRALVDRMAEKLGDGLRFWLGPRGLGTADDARASPRDAGSTNFLATAYVIAGSGDPALLIDMGSTTTDVIAVLGAPPVAGLTDAERLESGELVYTGLTRTPVASVADRAPFQGRWQALTRDNFASMADVRHILGELPDGVDQHDTADGRGKSIEESLARFARGFGRDAQEVAQSAWIAPARFIAERQVRSIHDACLQVLSKSAQPPALCVVAAGIGADVVLMLAARLGLPGTTFGDLIGAPESCRVWATRCAPAVAVALLADRQ